MDNLNRFHSFYTERPRHWCPQSERYTGGDALLTLLSSGWQLQEDVYYEEYWHGGARRVLIYSFILTLNDDTVTLRVLGNPFVERLLQELPLRVVPTAGVRGQMRQPAPAGE